LLQGKIYNIKVFVSYMEGKGTPSGAEPNAGGVCVPKPAWNATKNLQVLKRHSVRFEHTKFPLKNSDIFSLQQTL
jgi:hypothetical protein